MRQTYLVIQYIKPEARLLLGLLIQLPLKLAYALLVAFRLRARRF
jgi:hypothetical protein